MRGVEIGLLRLCDELYFSELSVVAKRIVERTAIMTGYSPRLLSDAKKTSHA